MKEERRTFLVFENHEISKGQGCLLGGEKPWERALGPRNQEHLDRFRPREGILLERDCIGKRPG